LRERPVRSRLAALAVLACALAGAAVACTDAPPRPPTASEVYGRAMKALEAGSLADLDPWLSAAGKDQVRRDLLAWRDAALRDPVEGPRVFSRLPPGARQPSKALVEKALQGDVASLLALYVAIDPHPVGSAAPPPEPTTATVEYRYLARDGSHRRVILSKRGEVWAIEQLAL
jgi:hypothetical protein